jgi:hypothetical protein
MKKYNVCGEFYNSEELKKAYSCITGIEYNDPIYDKPLTDEEIQSYLIEEFKN